MTRGDREHILTFCMIPWSKFLCTFSFTCHRTIILRFRQGSIVFRSFQLFSSTFRVEQAPTSRETLRTAPAPKGL
jgi:hypothetical protein